VLENSLSSHPGVKIQRNLSLVDLEYADDVGVPSDPKKAQTILDDVVTWADYIGLKVRAGKTQFTAMNHNDSFSLTVFQVQLDQVDGFTHLGSQRSTDGS
jgi:hypothetical protein